MKKLSSAVIDFECFIDDQQHNVLYIDVEKHKMEQVVRNFMTNAIKFMPQGGKITVKVFVIEDFSNGNPLRFFTGDAIMRVEVQDTGPGMTKVLIIIRIL
jgi:signal transduction histidine kinase